MRLKTAVLAVVAALSIGPGAWRAVATDLNNVLVDYALTSWGQKDGLPSSAVWAIAQDHDGDLWLGTDAGPVRFDGTRFMPLEPRGSVVLPSGPVRALCVSTDGSVWFGLGDAGGISRLLDGALQNYGPGDGLAGGAVNALLQDHDGIIWAGTSAGLYRFDRQRWIASGQGLAGSPVQTLAVDHRGGLFVGTDAGVFRRVASDDRFTLVDGGDIVRGLAEDRAGTMWVTDPIVGFRRVNDRRTFSPVREQGRGNRLLVDASGNLWVGTSRQGLWRVRLDARSGEPRLEKTSALVGFSDDGVVSLFQDAEGTVWAGTLDGLNRLTPHTVTPITNLGVVTGLAATADGAVWVGTADSIVKFPQGDSARRERPRRMPGVVTAMHADAGGRLFVATANQLFVIDGSRQSPMNLPLPNAPTQITALTSGADGELWIGDARRGLLRWDGHVLRPVVLPPQLQHARILTLYRDSSDVVWVTFSDGQLAAVSPRGTVDAYDRQRIQAGTIRVVYEDRQGALWFGGTEGLARFEHGRLSTLRSADRLPEQSVSAIVEDLDGALWIGTEGAGIVRVERTEIERALTDAHHPLRYRLFDKFDGFAGTARWFGNRSALRTANGVLWFIGGRGVTIVDPRALPAGPAPSLRARIEGVLADDRRVDSPSAAPLQARTSRLQIDYSVLNLRAPLRTRFRYRLDGFDADWVDAGIRRQAFYTNLSPGRYRFHVVASNDDATWGDAEATWAFVIPPRFYQTTWFRGLSVVALVLAVGATWRLHVRRVRNRFALLLGERARLSREIHDTLLQGLYGVALRCEGIARRIGASDDWLQQQFHAIRADVQGYIQDARQSIHDLRSTRLEGSDLTAALRESAARATAGTPIRLEVAVSGVPSDCSGAVEQQLLRIGQEAILNAVRHANASAVHVELRYEPGAVRLRVRDDGCGFDPQGVAESAGHYGLASMRERVALVGGRLRVDSGHGRGAQVEAVVPL